ncbi:MAG: peptide ABC transporter substrate-binding protein [Gemmatimonadaceae bacterium]|jgi:peptide/nickel transport system substrate-binding protein|nr:peptide ABC transporter substrate-binding protein [Gemmatimonadaceae bacterium]
MRRRLSFRHPAVRLVRALGVVSLTGVAACGDRGAATTAAADGTGGTLVIAVAGDPNTLFPPLATTTQSQAIARILFERLAEIGPALNTVGDGGFTPRLAERWTWSADSMQLTFRLAPGARWHDGAPVRARDVQFGFQITTNPAVASVNAPFLENIDSVSTPDSLTATVWFKRRKPSQFFDVVYNLDVLPAHRLDSIPPAALAQHPLTREPVGTGRFRFERWERGALLELVSDTLNVRGRAKLDRVLWKVAPDFAAATITLFAGDADFLETLRPENVAELAKSPALRVLPYDALAYGFLGFNLRARGTGPSTSRPPHPVLGDVQVRRALSMAVDRARLVRNVFDSLGRVAIGPAPRALFPDTTSLRPLPFDVAHAKALLDSAGWVDGNGDGVREKNGVALAFEIMVPTSSETRRRFAILLQEQLQAVGAKVGVDALELNTVIARASSRDFDAYMGSWSPTPGLAGIPSVWGSRAARAEKGQNWQSYESAAFDAGVTRALESFDPATSRTAWVQAYQQILDDAPSVWLYEPRAIAGIHRRVRPTGLRADQWYAGLADWQIDPAERLPRDQIGLRATR